MPATLHMRPAGLRTILLDAGGTGNHVIFTHCVQTSHHGTALLSTRREKFDTLLARIIHEKHATSLAH